MSKNKSLKKSKSKLAYNNCEQCYKEKKIKVVMKPEMNVTPPILRCPTCQFWKVFKEATKEQKISDLEAQIKALKGK